MLSVEQIRERMVDRKASVVARAIGISSQAMNAILLGKTNPSYVTLVKLSEYFEDRK